MEPIKEWKVDERKSMAAHLKICPYNIRSCHDGWCVKSEMWNSVLNGLRLNLKQKQISSMLINDFLCIYLKRNLNQNRYQGLCWDSSREMKIKDLRIVFQKAKSGKTPNSLK